MINWTHLTSSRGSKPFVDTSARLGTDVVRRSGGVSQGWNVRREDGRGKSDDRRGKSRARQWCCSRVGDPTFGVSHLRVRRNEVTPTALRAGVLDAARCALLGVPTRWKKVTCLLILSTTKSVKSAPDQGLRQSQEIGASESDPSKRTKRDVLPQVTNGLGCLACGASSRWSCVASFLGCPSFWSGRFASSVLGVDCRWLVYRRLAVSRAYYISLSQGFPHSTTVAGHSQVAQLWSCWAQGQSLIIDGCWAVSYCEWAARAG